jgi:hypothetical protein
MDINYYVERFQLDYTQQDIDRYKRLDIYERVLDGSIYDKLQPFYREYQSAGGSYIPLAQRRPSVKYKLARIIVNDSVAMLFGEGHFPMVSCADTEHQATTQLLQEITQKSNLRLAMLEAAKKGSVGSVCVIVKVVKGHFLFEVLASKCLTPVFDQEDQNILVSLKEKYCISGKLLKQRGYDVKPELSYYVCREWTTTEEIYYEPYPVSKDNDSKFKPSVDKNKSTDHNLGFVPAVWIKNLPDHDGDVDGQCTFDDAIDIGIEIDYQLSQHGRLLKYNSDPTLVVKDPNRLEGEQLVKGMNALMVGQDGDAKYLQLDNAATTAVMEYVRTLRTLALETVRGDRSNPEKLLAGHSGKALQMLNKPLISLVDEMRLTYGEIGLLTIYRMMLTMIKDSNVDIDLGENKLDAGNCEEHLLLKWPPFYAATDQDKSEMANTLKTLTDSGNLSHETAVKSIADLYDITDLDEEMRLIAENQQNLIQQGAQIKETINA